MNRIDRFFSISAFCVLLASAASADELVFKNGDRLVGKVLSAADGKAVVDSASAGKVAVALADLKTFATDEPLEIHFKDGTVLRRKASLSQEEGKFAIDGEGVVAGQAFVIVDIAKINPPPVQWTGSVSAGFTATGGNTKTMNSAVDISAQRRSDQDRLTFNAGYFSSRQEDPTTGVTSTTKRYQYGSLQYDYFFSKDLYGYANTKLEKDAIALLDMRVTAGVGAGYQIFDAAAFALGLEAGVAYLSENYSGPTPSSDSGAGRAAYHVTSQLSPSAKAFHNAEWLRSFEDPDDQNAKADAGVRASLTGSMFAEAKVVWQWDATPAIGKGRQDTTYILSVGWTF